MNVTEEMANNAGYDKRFAMTKWSLETTFGECELLFATDTLQFDDYDKYDSEAFDGKAKLKRRAEVFPDDCRRAFDLGIQFKSLSINFVATGDASNCNSKVYLLCLSEG